MHKLKFTGSCDLTTFEDACTRQDFWYHSYYFDNGFQMIGDYNIGLDIHDYGFPEDMTGLKVLDIGTGGGWFAHYFEQQGADVTTVDARGYCDFDFRRRYDYPTIESEKPEPDRIAPDGSPIYYSPVSGGFWVMKDLLGSKVRYVNARVYDISEELFGGEKFDLVFIGSLLLHLRDPVGALMSARKVCADRLIATTPVLDDGRLQPHMYLYLATDDITWWRPNIACFRHWFLEAGFSSVNIERSVSLSAEKPIPSPVFDGPRNPTQIMRIGDARVRGDESRSATGTASRDQFSAAEHGWQTLDEVLGKLETHSGAPSHDAAKPVASPSENALGEDVAELILHGPNLEMPAALGTLGRAFRRLVFRAIQNYHLHQQKVGQALLQTLRDLAAGTGAQFVLVGRELRWLAESYERSLRAVGEDTEKLEELVRELERQIEELKASRMTEH